MQGQENSNALADDRMFKGKEVVIHTADGRRLQMSYGDAKKQGISLDDMTILNANEAQANRDKYASVATTMDHVKRYRNDFKTVSSQLTDQDRSALGVLTSHSDKVADSFLGVAQSGIIDTLIGKPLTGYSEKLMGAWMTKDQYDKMSPAGKRDRSPITLRLGWQTSPTSKRSWDRCREIPKSFNWRWRAFRCPTSIGRVRVQPLMISAMTSRAGPVHCPR